MSFERKLRRARPRHRELSHANHRAIAGAGIPEADVLEAMNKLHVAVLEQPLGGGGIQIHLGLARHGKGRPFCTAGHGGPTIIARESLGAFRSPYFSIRLPEQQRWWCGIVWLEQNRGCPSCVSRAYQYADEQGWAQPRRLGELLGIGGGPARDTSSGPSIGAKGFTRG